MNPNGHNGWKPDGVVGIKDSERSGFQEEPFEWNASEEELGKSDEALDQARHRASRRRRRWAGFAIFALLIVASGLMLWSMFGDRGKTKIDLQVRDPRKTNSGSPGSDDVTAQAIAEIRAAASPAPAIPAVAAGSNTPVTVPLETPRATDTKPADQTADTTAAAKTRGGIASTRNPEKSIRCALVPGAKESLTMTTPAAHSQSVSQPIEERAGPTLARPALLLKDKQVAVPSFGTMLPVRTLGSLFTLRPSLARFELTRDTKGDGWNLKRGTVLVGQQQGSQYDRAYITLTGFIDPDSGKLIRINGDLLGADGAPGLKGKRRQIHSRWTSVLGRTATSAVNLGQAALSRGTAIYMPNPISPELNGLSSGNQREFVEIAAGAPAYVIVTDLPKTGVGVDAQPFADGRNSLLSDEEMADLLSTGSPEKIRAAMPRMSPELRRVAEMALKESR
jgi:hypothetical protein